MRAPRATSERPILGYSKGSWLCAYTGDKATPAVLCVGLCLAVLASSVCTGQVWGTKVHVDTAHVLWWAGSGLPLLLLLQLLRFDLVAGG